MECKKCKKDIDEDSLFCKFCGFKVNSEHKKKKRSNGLGTVYKVNGRRKPWNAYITQNKKRVFLGSFLTQTEANKAILTAQSFGVSDKNNYTLETLYNEWSDVHFRNISESRQNTYKSAWKWFAPICKMKVRDIKTDSIQNVIDECAKKNSRGMCTVVKSLASLLCKKAMEYDILNKNYAEFVSLPSENKNEKDVFTAA